MMAKLLTEHHLEFLSLTGGCRGSSESTLVKLLEILCRGSFIFIWKMNQYIMKAATFLFIPASVFFSYLNKVI